MQNLVIGILAIVISTITVASGTYYLSDAWENNAVKGEAAKYQNQNIQVTNAIQLYESDGNVVGSSFSLQTLVAQDYLSSIPEGWTEYPDMIGSPIQGSLAMKESVCMETNLSAGFTFTPDGVNYKKYIEDETLGIPYCTASLDPSVPCCIYTN